jgi:carbamoyltransferase
LYILGVSDSHNSTACLLKDGAVIACASEERFNRKKNYDGVPELAIGYCLQAAGITGCDLTEVAITGDYKQIVGFREFVNDFLVKPLGSIVDSRSFNKRMLGWLYYSHFAEKRQRPRFTKRVCSLLGIPASRIRVVDHHLSHAYSSLYASGLINSDGNVLVITCDAQGDGLCSTVGVFDGERYGRIAKTTFADSLGWFYFYITSFLGMKPTEDEHKVMGLAPYGRVTDTLAKKISGFMTVRDDLSLSSSIHSSWMLPRIERIFERERFDRVAAAAQQVTEEVLVDLVRKSILKTGIRSVVLAGGVFMNVKANMAIAKLSETNHVFVIPSCGDESTAIGGAYISYLEHNPNGRIQPIGQVYWGPDYTTSQVREAIGRFDSHLLVEEHSRISEVIADLLAKGEVVARFDGRMEYGARALGNRSILADGSDRAVVDLINRAVKNRDFWMPFAPVILDEFVDKYIAKPEPSKVDPEYMIFAFDTTVEATTHLAAAMHPYDKTVRPQVIRKGWNDRYREIVVSFGEETGKFGLLNTSFNLHGEPIVCSPEDAITTFLRCGLRHLAIGDFLLSKKGAI